MGSTYRRSGSRTVPPGVVAADSRVALTPADRVVGTSLTGGYCYRQVNFGGGSARIGRFRLLGRTPALRGSATSGPDAVRDVESRVRHARPRPRDRSGRPRVLHNVQAGINYGRPLSISRRTSFSFSTGSAIAVRDDLSNPDAAPATTARLTGNASLTHELGRTWTARATYRRGLTLPRRLRRRVLLHRQPERGRWRPGGAAPVAFSAHGGVVVRAAGPPGPEPADRVLGHGPGDLSRSAGSSASSHATSTTTTSSARTCPWTIAFRGRSSAMACASA
jgi:hypothetical protein